MSQAKDLALSLNTQFRAKHKLNDELQQAQGKELYDFLKERDNAVRAYIISDRLLDACTWNLTIHNGRISLTAKEYSDNPKLKELSALTETDYHCGFALQFEEKDDFTHEFVTLRYDDGEVRIMFEGNEYVAAFVKAFGLKVNTSGIDKQVADLRQSIDTLEQLKTQVNIGQ